MSEMPVGLKGQTLYFGFLRHDEGSDMYTHGCVTEDLYWRIQDMYPNQVMIVFQSEESQEAMLHAVAVCGALREKYEKRDLSEYGRDDNERGESDDGHGRLVGGL